MADGRITIDTKIDQSGIDEGVKTMQGKLNRVADKMDKVGKKMSTTVTAPIAGLTGAVIKIGMDFEASMSHVQAVTGATGSEMQKLESLAKELGETTKFSANDAAEAMGFLGMAGYKTNQIMSAMPGLLDLAASGQLELGRAADIATNIVSGFNMAAKDTGMVSDVLAKAAASANTSVEQLGAAMSYVAPVAAGAGISLQETAAAIGILSDAGIQGERAGTALRGIIASLQNPTGGTNRALEKLGLTAADIDPTMNSLADILRKLESAGIDSKTAMELVGVEAGPALLAMLNRGSGGLKSFAQDLTNSEGAAAQMAKTMSDNTKGSFDEFTSALEGVALAFADILLPIVTDFLDFITILVRKFGEMPVAVQKIILIISGIAAAIGPLLLIISGVIKAFTTFTTILPIIKNVGTAIGFLTNPVGLVIAAVAGLVALIIIYWDEIKAVTEAVFGWIAEFLSNLWDEIKEVASIAWEGITNFLSEVWTAISEVAVAIWQPIADFLEGLWEVIKTVAMAAWNVITVVLTELWQRLLDVATPIFQGIADFISGVWEWIKDRAVEAWNILTEFLMEIWNTIYEAVQPIFQAVHDFIMGIWEGIRDTAAVIWEGLIEILTIYWETIKENATVIFTAIMDVLTAIWEGIRDITMSIWDTISEYLSIVWNTIKDVAFIIWNAIKDTLSLIWYMIKTLAQGNFDSIAEIIDIVWGTIKDVTSTIWNAIKDALLLIWDGIKNATSTVFNGIKNTISTIWDTIRNVTSSVWNGIWNIISSIINNISSAISKVFNTIKNTVTGVWNGIKSATDRIWNGIVNAIKGAANTIIGVINSIIGAIGSINIPIPKIPDWVPGLGGKGGGSIGFPKLPKIPSLDVGTNFVAKDGLAFLHKGEAVVPKKYNPAAGGKGGDINITVQEMHVRSEEDIYKVSRQLKRLQDRALLSKGTGGVSTI